MNWVISTTRDGHYYNPATHELKPKKDWLEQQIAGKKDLIKRMTTRMTEIIGDIEKEIEELEKQLEEP
jgi:Mg2+ and Co2+ transporter CorA